VTVPDSIGSAVDAASLWRVCVRRLHGVRRHMLVAGKWGLGLALAAEALLTPGFLELPALLSLLTTVSFIGCVAVGMTLITLGGGIMSLSLGATVGACSIVCLLVANQAGVVAGMAASVACGCVLTGAQGAMVGYLRANPIIVSIAASVLVYAIAQPITGNTAIYADVPMPKALLSTTFFGAPFEFVVFVVLVALTQLMLSFSRFGRQIYLVGTSFRAAQAARIRVGPTVLGAYAWAGAASAVAGILLALRYGRASMDVGIGMDYPAIAAVLVGGTAITGGRGSAFRTFGGVMIIGIVQVLLLLRGFRQEWQFLITGVVVLLVILLNSGAQR